MLFWLIENEEQVKTFLNRGYKEAFIEIIPYNYFSHPCDNKTSLLYIRPLDSNKGFIFSVDHDESFPVQEDVIYKILNSFEKIYVRDKKEFLHYFICNNIFDITLNAPYELKFLNIHNFFDVRQHNKYDINKIIPISKHYEFCEIIYNDLKNNIKLKINDFYNRKATLVFNTIERMGIRIQGEEYKKFFPPTEKNIIYTQYNFKTLTTRPSNHFNKINFSALNKENGCRKAFIPKNDKFVEFDITAYHPNILADLIKYKFPTRDIHSELSKLYNLDYNKSKQRTFQIIYGGRFEKYIHIEFFRRAKEFTDKIWDEFNTKGYIKCELTGFKFEKDKLSDMNPSKLLNYLIQQRETVKNINLIWDMIKILRNKNSQLIMYVYDSFLIDFSEGEEETLDKIRDLFKINNLLIKEKTGYNYNSLE